MGTLRRNGFANVSSVSVYLSWHEMLNVPTVWCKAIRWEQSSLALTARAMIFEWGRNFLSNNLMNASFSSGVIWLTDFGFFA
jgi:hypothetical protein